ncbi:MAG: TonB-dependent receptor [Bacteroidetes bacterium]|nr:TonB-dependent receptor [Bacteroidota bacterium]
MIKLSALLAVLFVFCTAAYSQTITVSGNLKDTIEKKPIKNAVVALLTPGDSILYRFTRTDAQGNFSLKNIKQGVYIVMTTHPFYADLVFNTEAANGNLNLGTLAVTSKSKLLQEVIVKSGNPIRIKGDTTIYTADSFKVSANANVEELLKKLPGIQVDKDGKIKAMGETVEKVLVDGEEFFGDDPGMAVKNLRADAVKEVQVFDKKSDQAEFTGIDDGKTQKTINLKMKEDRKTGYFGKVDMAGGPQKSIDDRYNTNLMYSSFKGKRKISGFVLNGNTGQDGLSWQDNDKYGGSSDNFSMSMDDDGGVMFMYRGGSGDDEPYVNTQNGFIRNTNIGLQYSNKWNDKQTLNFSPKYNSQIYTNNKTDYTRLQIGDTAITTNESVKTNVNRNNFKTNLTYDVKIDSNNSIKFTARGNFYHTESEEITDATTTNYKDLPTNIRSTTTQNTSDKQAFSGSILFKHKFKKARRTFSLNTDWSSLNSDGTGYLKQSINDIYNGINRNIDQQKLTDKLTQNLNVAAVYTEPLSKKYSLEFSHQISVNNGHNNQTTYSYTPGTNKYDVLVDSLTNFFDQHIIVNRPSFKINYGDKKLKYNFGSGFAFTSFDFTDVTQNKDYLRHYTNFFPQATLTYSYKANHSLRFNYNGNTQQPSLNQLQPLRNNEDYLNLYIGNPNLKPSFSNNFNLSHNGYNFIKDIWTYQSINVRATSNSITNNRTISAGGKTVTQPINTNGNISVSFWGGGGFKWKKPNIRVGFNPNVSYNKFADVINGQTSYSRTWNAGGQIYLNKSKDKKYDISLNNDFSWNRNTNSQSTLNNQYYTNNTGLYATVYYKKVWSITSDYNVNIRQKTAQFPTNLNTNIWNAKLSRTFKNDEFTAYALVRDILNQNISIERDFYSNTISEVRNDRLKRYFMIGFTWNFKNPTAAPKTK